MADRLRGTEEGQVFVWGLALTAAFVTELVLLLVLAPAWGRPIATAVPIDMFSGKEAALPVALAGGAPWYLVAQVSTLQHIALGTVAFPVFLFLLHRYQDRDNLLMRRLRRIERAADHHKAFVTKWGPVGVFLFMMVPFLVNGPLVGGILGRLAGIGTKYLILPVVAASLISSLLWARGYDFALGFVEGVDPRLPAVMAVSIIVLAVGLALFDEYRERKKERAIAEAAEEAARDASREPPSQS
jgi:uncharacterized membrane protein